MFASVRALVRGYAVDASTHHQHVGVKAIQLDIQRGRTSTGFEENLGQGARQTRAPRKKRTVGVLEYGIATQSHIVLA